MRGFGSVLTIVFLAGLLIAAVGTIAMAEEPEGLQDSAFESHQRPPSKFDHDLHMDIVEDGDSFAANAILKAAGQARHLGRWVLADDSGLEVDALGGAPGVYSARYAGPDATDDENNQRLLADLGDLPIERRTARYVCHVAVADPVGTIRAESHDTCRGRIRHEEVGTNGFGYDPMFEVVEYHRTFGQLGPHVKQALSHRSRALRAILPQLLALAPSCSAP